MNNCSLSPRHIAGLLDADENPLKAAYDKSRAERIKREADVAKADAALIEARGIAAVSERIAAKRDKMFYVVQVVLLVAAIVNLIFALN